MELMLKKSLIMKMEKQSKALFATIIFQCSPIHPKDLYEKFKEICCNDVDYRLIQNYKIKKPQ